MRSLYCIPYVRCALCGGEGDAHIRHARYLFSAEFFHQDPSVCKDILAAKARREALAAQREAA